MSRSATPGPRKFLCERASRGLRKFLGALGPASPPGVARRSPPTRIGRPEGQTNQRFSLVRSAAELNSEDTKVAGRRAGANTPPATGQAFAPPTRCAGGVIVRERRRPATCGVAVALLSR